MSRTIGLVAVLFLAAAFVARAAEVMPPKPARYFNDEAGVVSKEAALRFNEQLAQFERETSNQLVVAVYPKMQTDSDIADYTQRIAQSWAVGQAERRNGAVLFVFKDDRKMFIQVGYGLEGVIPDVTAFEITERNIKPRFRANDYEGGLATGIALMMKAARGEYTGTGRTAFENSKKSNRSGAFGCLPFVLILAFFIFGMIYNARQRKRRGGWGYSGGGGPFIGGWSSGGGSSGGWSSGSSGGGFSGFSGGGGSFGGGGAGSDW